MAIYIMYLLLLYILYINNNKYIVLSLRALCRLCFLLELPGRAFETPPGIFEKKITPGVGRWYLNP